MKSLQAAHNMLVHRLYGLLKDNSSDSGSSLLVFAINAPACETSFRRCIRQTVKAVMAVRGSTCKPAPLPAQTIQFLMAQSDGWHVSEGMHLEHRNAQSWKQ